MESPGLRVDPEEKRGSSSRSSRKDLRVDVASSSLLESGEADDDGELFWHRDAVLVFDQDVVEGQDALGYFEEGPPNAFQNIIGRLQTSDVNTQIFRSAYFQNELIFVAIGATMARLNVEAQHSTFRVRLDPASARAEAEALGSDFPPTTARPEACGCSCERHLDPFEYIYCEYHDSMQRLFEKKGDGTVLRGSHRIRLLRQILRSSSKSGGLHTAGLDIDRLVHDGVLHDFYFLHHDGSRDALDRQWSRCHPKFWTQPLWHIRNYFGEKVALYFAFLQFYTANLTLAAVIGVGFFAFNYVYSKNGAQQFKVAPGIPCHTLVASVIAVWSVLMLQCWRRRVKWLSVKWGVENLDRTEEARPQYRPHLTRASLVDARPVAVADETNQYAIAAAAFVPILVLIVTVIGCVIAVVGFQVFLHRCETSPLSNMASQAAARATGSLVDRSMVANFLASTLNGVMITVFHVIYKKLAIGLTNLENHRTESKYESNLIIKLYLFQFVNNYSSLIYTGFVEPNIEMGWWLAPDAPKDQNKSKQPLEELKWSLLFTYLSLIVCENLTYVLFPLLLKWVHRWTEMRAARQHARHRRKTAASANEAEGAAEAAAKAAVAGDDEAEAEKEEEEEEEDPMKAAARPLLADETGDGGGGGDGDDDAAADGEDGDAADHHHHMSRTERQFLLGVDEKKERTLVHSWVRMTIQFGYVTLFFVALPLAPLLSLVHNLIMMKMVNIRLLHETRRPFPDMAEDTGVVLYIMYFTAFAAIVSNAALIIVDEQTKAKEGSPGGAGPSDIAWAVLGFEHIVVVLVGVALFFIKVTPASVQEHLGRQEFLQRLLIDRPAVAPPNDHFTHLTGGSNIMAGLKMPEILACDPDTVRLFVKKKPKILSLKSKKKRFQATSRAEDDEE